MVLTRRLYLVVFLVLAGLAAAGLYLRHRADVAAAAACDTPAPPPPPTAAPPPELPGFAVEAGCGPSGAPPAKTP